MASELLLQASLKFNKGGSSLITDFGSVLFDVAGTAFNKQTQTIGTADEVLVLGDVSSIGFVAFKNLDPTNSIYIGSDGTLYPIILRPLGFAVMEWNAAAIHAKAITANCIIEYSLVAE